MKICAAQTRPAKGDIDANIERHRRLIERAVSCGADLIVFPELSLTGYEPRLARELATGQEDRRLDVFQAISDANSITIGVGIPTKGHAGIRISMVIFQPDKPRRTYSKQHLHPDELPYFVNGNDPVILKIGGKAIAPAICYESLLQEHVEKALNSGAEIYIASVAKSAGGVAKAYQHYPEIAKRYSFTVLMSNCLGRCDDFESVGGSSVWNENGTRVGQLNDHDEGLLLFDTVKGTGIQAAGPHPRRPAAPGGTANATPPGMPPDQGEQ